MKLLTSILAAAAFTAVPAFAVTPTPTTLLSATISGTFSEQTGTGTTAKAHTETINVPKLAEAAGVSLLTSKLVFDTADSTLKFVAKKAGGPATVAVLTVGTPTVSVSDARTSTTLTSDPVTGAAVPHSIFNSNLSGVISAKERANTLGNEVNFRGAFFGTSVDSDTTAPVLVHFTITTGAPFTQTP
jgi:hypothetical protein